MTLPNGFEKDLQQALGSRRLGTLLIDALNDAGADNSSTINAIVPSGGTLTVTAGTVNFVDGVVTTTIDNGGFTVSNSGSNAVVTTLATTVGVVAVEHTNVGWTMTAGASPDSLVESILSTTGAYKTALTANLADAYAITDGTTTFVTYITTTGSLGVQFSGQTLGLRRKYIAVGTTPYTVTAAESGSTYVTTVADVVFTLPATVAGLEYTFINNSVSGGTGLSLDPVAADKIMGKGLAKADDANYVNSGASDAVGDTTTIVGDGVDGWWVTTERGTWA